jgi:hypothetical protein
MGGINIKFQKVFIKNKIYKNNKNNKNKNLNLINLIVLLLKIKHKLQFFFLL